MKSVYEEPTRKIRYAYYASGLAVSTKSVILGGAIMASFVAHSLLSITEQALYLHLCRKLPSTPFVNKLTSVLTSAAFRYLSLCCP